MCLGRRVCDNEGRIPPRRLLASLWTDEKPAIEVLPSITRQTVVHAGPPINWERED
jgi:hypothetical protein